MTVLDARPAQERVKADLDEDHLYCCDPDVSLCGLDISDLDLVEGGFVDVGCPFCALVKGLDLPCGPECREVGS